MSTSHYLFVIQTISNCDPSHLTIDNFLDCSYFDCVISVLLQHGADPNIRNTDGKTALDLSDPSAKSVLTGEYKKDELLEAARSGNEEKMMSLLSPLNVNCHASDGRKVHFCYCYLCSCRGFGNFGKHGSCKLSNQNKWASLTTSHSRKSDSSE